MANFVLIHGAWHGAWCWERVSPLLAARGHRVTAIDLPGLGADPTPAHEVTFDLTAARIVASLEAQSGPATLVGHSLGGSAITRAAELRPELLESVIYLAAYLPDAGESVFSAARRLNPDMPPPPTFPVAEGCAIMIDAEAAVGSFYGHCSSADIALAKSKLTPQPVQPLGAPVEYTEGRFGRVPRAYIECLDDKAVPIAAQRAMGRQRPGTLVGTLNGDHSPFFSNPTGLTELLSQFARH